MIINVKYKSLLYAFIYQQNVGNFVTCTAPKNVLNLSYT